MPNHPSNPPRRRTLALCVALAAGMFPLGAAAQPAGAVMPASFANVVLGMSQADLLRARPGIAADGFKGDTTGHAKLLFEKAQSDLIGQAIYLFDEARPVLVAVVFARQRPTPAARGIDAFRAAVAAKWGVPDQVAYGRAETGGREIALVWRRPDALVLASYPADGKAGATTVRIGAPGSIVASYVNKLEAMDKGTQDKLKQDMREQARRNPAAVPFQ